MKDWDTILVNVLIVVLVLLSVLSVFVIRDYIGYVAYHGAKGGTITAIEVQHQRPAYNWNGIAGIALQSPLLNTSWFVYANQGEISELNPVFTCLEPGITHEIYATTLTSAEIDWESVTAGTPQMLDDYTNTSYDELFSANRTFTDTIEVELGENVISGVPATYMYQHGNPGSHEYPVGILQYEGDLIMVAVINTDFLIGYRPDKIYNYEMMVPVPPAVSDLRYNIYTDPFDECPQGQGGELFEPGAVHGWVKSEETGAFLENVIVGVGNDIYITGADGFFNITGLQPGSAYIVGIKTGYANYVENVTVLSGNATEHNLSMKIVFDEQLTGTGPGVGTGPGEDAPGTETQTGEGPGIGPGVGPGIGPWVERPEDIGADHWISLDKLRKKIRLETFFTENLLIFSFREEEANIDIEITGNATQVLEISDTSATIAQNQYANISIRGLGHTLGKYTGAIEISGTFNDTLPVEIIVTDEDKLAVEALLVELDVLTRRPLPGKVFKFGINLQNLLTDEQYDVRLDYFLRGVESTTSNVSHYVGNDTVSLLTSHTLIKEVVIPPEWPKGDYYLIVEANYLDLYSRTSTLFELFEPLHQYKVFGLIELWKILAFLAFVATVAGIILYVRHRINAQKRFHAKVEYNLLPQKGPRSLRVGKIAETEKDTFFDMDKLTVHSIVAGSTGGGKTIAAQVIIEECLLKDVGVVVFDPTAQWTGMLRKCKDEKMMSFYPRFGLSKKDSRAFNGNIRAITNAREKINVKNYWKPGEIQVFTTNKLDPRDMDMFVANTVREIFHSNLQEYRGLRFMMVYDEIHRILPKFGGTGEGFVQIERACREFRKWGIGVMLVSQVLADFVGQIKANINTEVQMKTRDEGDLKRIETKYGTSYIQELVKSPVGSGMVQNSSWNRGRPYYVTFRPILHSVVRLTDEELEQYNKYNEVVDDLYYQLDQLEEEGKDVFDLRLELKLALDKIKGGSFNMVEIYLEGLKPRIEKIWKDLGKTPKKKEIELVSEEELKQSIEAAKEDSKNAESKEGDAGGKEEAKALGLDDDVPPDKILTMVNGTLVVQLRALLDEINALKDDEFKQHVNEDKNDFSDWIRNAIGNDKWADIADKILTKQDYVSFLKLLYEGKEKTFKPTAEREKPYSSKGASADDKKEADDASQPKDTEGQAPDQQSKEPASAGPQQPAQQPQPVQDAQQEQPVQSGGQQPAQQPQPAQKPATQQQPAQQSNQQPSPQQPTQQPQPAQQGGEQPAPQAPLDMDKVKQDMQTKSPQEKVAYLSGLADAHPHETEILFMLAAQYHKQQNLAKAEEYYKKVLSVNPNHVQALYYLASVYNGQKRYRDALDMYQKIKGIQPDYPKVNEYIASLQKVVQ